MVQDRLRTETLAFLVTDVEGSTARWNDDERAMSRAMRHHNTTIEENVAVLHGTMLEGEGDSRAACFRTPLDAVEAAGRIQLALASAPPELRLLVRIGVHHGEVFELSPGVYGGAALCFLGRLHKAAHGGQILVSDATAQEVVGSLPAGWTLEDLGDHVFRDFYRRRVYQASLPGLRTAFPPLAVRRGTSLPTGPGTTFVGRQHELELTTERLGSRVTTIVGPAGLGKTRLAHEMARALEPHYRDGVTIIELAGAKPEQVALAVANALYINPQLEATTEGSLERSLRGRQLLVILDNCEDVLHSAMSVACLLVKLDDVDVLATSRAPLGLPEEDVRALSPLSLPPEDARTDSIASSDAVRLFVDRARGVRPGFALDASNAAAVGEVCRRVSGVPLAIELAAAALRSVSLADLPAHVESESEATSGARVQQGFSWSLERLGDDERAVLNRLAVFPGGGSRALLCGFRDNDDVRESAVLAILDSLVQRSLVQFDDTLYGGHYRMLEPMRWTALRGLPPAARSALDAEHARLIAELATRLSADTLQTGDEARAVDELDRLTASIRTQVNHDITRQPERAASVCISLHEHCMLRMRYEVYDWVSRLADRDDLGPGLESQILAMSGLGAFNRGDLDTARSQCERSLALAAEAGTEPLVQAHFGLMVAYGFSGDFDRAQAHFSAAATWCSGEGRGYFLVNTLVLAAMALTIQGRADVAVSIASNALEHAEAIKNPSALAWALTALADGERLSSPGAAHAHLDEALATARQVRSRWIEGQALLNLAKLRRSTSKEDSATVLVDALSSVEQTGSPIHGRQALRLAMVLLTAFDRCHDAAMLQWAARQDHSVLPPAPDLASAMAEAQERIDDRIGPDTAAALRSRGRRTPDAELVTLARSSLIAAIG